MNDDFDCVMTMTNKFIKRIIILFDKFTYTTKNWVNVFIIDLMTDDWNISRFIVNDKNKKFMLNFWRAIFFKLKVSLLILTTYHSQTNDQFKHTNQILKIALKFWLFNSKNEDWIFVLSYFTTSFNNFVNVNTKVISNELSYDFRVNDSFVLLKNLSTKNYNQLRQMKRDFVEKAIVFVNVMHKRRYDKLHFDINFVVDNYVFIRFFVEYIISNLISHKLNQQRVELFKILKKIETLAYRLKLSSIMRIHSVIFITQLKSKSFENDFYDRVSNKDSSSMKNENAKSDFELTQQTSSYEIKRLLFKKMFRDKSKYLVKWKNYDNEHNVWYSFDVLNKIKNVIKKYEVKTRKTIEVVVVKNQNREKFRRVVTEKNKERFKKERARQIKVASSSINTSSSIFTSSSSITSSSTRRFTRLIETSSTFEEKTLMKKTWRSEMNCMTKLEEFSSTWLLKTWITTKTLFCFFYSMHFVMN